jgi:hypothetical protein
MVNEAQSYFTFTVFTEDNYEDRIKWKTARIPSRLLDTTGSVTAK